MGDFDLQADLELAGRLVREAGQLAAQMRVGGIETEFKRSVSDVVTAADRAAEQLVLTTLRRERPDDSIVGEEGASHSGSSGRTWLIDPVDGTYNFATGLTWWCSAIALRDTDDVLLGAIYHPHEDLLYAGGPNLGAFRNGRSLAPIPQRELAQCCATTYLHPPFYDGEVGAAFQRAIAGVATLRMMGSGSLDQMSIAQGILGVLFQHTVADWDWYPGLAIVRGAGGIGRKVLAGGVEWSVAGSQTAVDQVCEALTSTR